MYVRIVQCESVKACVHAFLYTRFHTFTLNSHFPAMHGKIRACIYATHTTHNDVIWYKHVYACSSLTYTHTLSLSLSCSLLIFSRALLFSLLLLAEKARALSLARTHTPSH